MEWQFFRRAHQDAGFLYETGVDLATFVAAVERLQVLIGHDIPRQIVKAGRLLDLH